MKSLLTFFSAFSFFVCNAQAIANFGAGFSNKGKAVANLEVGYQLKQVKIATGYLVHITDESATPDLFYLKAGQCIKFNESSGIDFGAGAALHTYKQETVSKIDHQYSYLKTMKEIKPLFYANYKKFVISDGAFVVQAVYSGGVLYGGVGLAYYFGQRN